MIRIALPRRRANIPPDLRKRFEKLGESIMCLVVAIESGDGTGTGQELGQELTDLGHHREEIVLWLQERRDLATRRERTMRRIAWVTVIIALATLVFVVLGVLLVLGFLVDHGRAG